MTAIRSRALGIAILSLIASAMPSTAAAHATLNTCTVAPNVALSAAPRTLSCTFAEGVNPRDSFIHVFEGSGDHAQVDLGNSQVSFTNAKQITLGLPKLGSGPYTVLWYTVSADDGHRAGGSFAFSVR